MRASAQADQRLCCQPENALATLGVSCEDSDQSVRMPRQIKVSAGRTCILVGIALPRLKCLYRNAQMCGLYRSSTVCMKALQLNRNVTLDMWAQRRFRLACAFAQSDQNLNWAHVG